VSTHNLTSADTKQILDGIHFLHENQAVHRDIKGANVLVAHNGILKIADFGATMMLSGQATMTEDGKQIQGTPYWMAPEVIKQEAYGRKADIWSLGMTVLEMSTAKHPWQTFTNKFAAMTEIASGLPPCPPPPLPSHLGGRDKEGRLRHWVMVALIRMVHLYEKQTKTPSSLYVAKALAAVGAWLVLKLHWPLLGTLWCTYTCTPGGPFDVHTPAPSLWPILSLSA